MNERQQRIYDNFTMMKALDEVDRPKAIEAISNPNLDGKELSEILECGFSGWIKEKSGEPMKLSNEVMMAGIRNKMNQVIDKANNETELHGL